MTTEAEQVGKDVNEFLQEVLPLTMMCRDSELQMAAQVRIAEWITRVVKFKSEAAERSDEDSANFLLSICCALDSVDKCISCLLKLKDDKPHEAWTSLVRSQEALKACLRAHPGGENMSEFSVLLYGLEQYCFPPQVYSSIGVTYNESFCSLCDSVYGDCNHIAGRPYMGRFCSQIVRESELLEISIVETPEDKCCIVTSFSGDSGRMIDRLTLKPTDESSSQPNSDQDGKKESQDG